MGCTGDVFNTGNGGADTRRIRGVGPVTARAAGPASEADKPRTEKRGGGREGRERERGGSKKESGRGGMREGRGVE